MHSSSALSHRADQDCWSAQTDSQFLKWFRISGRWIAEAARTALRFAVTALAILLLGGALMAASDRVNASFTVWVSNPLTKVFRDSTVPAQSPGEIRMLAVRNAYHSAQLCVTAEAQPIEVKVKLRPLAHASRPHKLGGSDWQVRAVGFVPVTRNTPNTPNDELVRTAPTEFPDPLLDDDTARVPPRRTQPFWLTLHVPKDTPAGEYTGKIEIVAGSDKASLPVTVTVAAITMPDQSPMWLTNWFSYLNLTKYHKVTLWSAQYWRLLESYARNMAHHYQNVIITPTLNLVKITEKRPGKLAFDFALFDQWVETFTRAGVIGMIEGAHLATRHEGNWDAVYFDFVGYSVFDEKGKLVRQQGPVPANSDESKAFLSQFLPALQKHLSSKGWLKKYVQHLADEPTDGNAEDYRKLAGMVKELAPKIRRLDANMTPNLIGALDIWVPILDQFDRDQKHYTARRKKGEEVWFYTCLAPTGHYPNRFIDYPLTKVRLLHWINYKYGAEGYLHWGYNYWTDDPLRNVEPGQGGPGSLPPGDAFIVYPGSRGPLDSIRFEALREGIQDYMLLTMYEQKVGRASAMRIADSLVREISDCERDPAALLTAREKLIEGFKTAKPRAPKS